MLGWVCIHRKIEENRLWFSEPFTKAQAWLDLVIFANHSDGQMYIRGNKITIKRGQNGWSELTMAKRWKWSRDKVRRFLSYLENESQIIQQKIYRITTVITIVNYEQYQTIQQTIQQKNNRQYNRQDTNNNDNNVNNENKGMESSRIQNVYTTDTQVSKNKFSKVSDITDSVLEELSQTYEVPVDFVRDCWDSACNWLDAQGTTKKNYKAFLANWVKRQKADFILKSKNFSKKGGVYDARSNQ